MLTVKRAGCRIKDVPNKLQKVMNTRLCENPVKSQSDKKDYRLICLENGLKALLIHHKCDSFEDEKLDTKTSDEDTDTDSESSDEEHEREKLAGVALCIEAGSFDDPVVGSCEGLAHFVEHMIFMGSEKYPKENELDQYLNASGGSSNALTECEHTLFYFDIVEEHLVDGIDRFSSLFIAPLMLRDAMAREIEAVNSEFQNNINNDENRLVQLCASKANGKASTFTWGNSKTLKEDIDADKLYEAVHEFRAKYYVANNMYLCIESSETLDSLQEIVEDYFSNIKSAPIQRAKCLTPYTEHFKNDFYDKMLYVKPNANKSKLYMTFVIPSMQKHYKTKPHDYLAYIIQHEGFGSLCSYLKRNLLALHVSAGAEDHSFEANSMFTLFSIEILLSDKGYENIETVLEAIFSVLLMLKTTPIDEHEKLYMELKQIRNTFFNFQEEKTSGENTEDYAVNMLYYDDADIITGPDQLYEFNGEIIMKIIDILNDDKFNLTILTDKHTQYPLKEKWFGTEYDEVDAPEKIKNIWKNRKLLSDFFMPEPNQFICSNFNIIYSQSKVVEQHQKILPQRVSNDENIELWYKIDNKFLLPHGFINCYLESPIVLKNTKKFVLLSIYSMIVKYYLAEKLYPAICAGLGYTINTAEKGLLIKLSGYNEKLVVVLDIITKELRDIPNKIEPKVFETYLEQSKKNGYNNLINSKFVTKDIRLAILESQHHFFVDQLDVLSEIHFDDLVYFAKEFPNELYTKIMVLGNFDKFDALRITETFGKNIQMKKFIDKKLLALRTRKIPAQSQHAVCVKSFLPDDKNSTITNYYQFGKSTIRNTCLVEFIENLMQEPLFDKLRTKEQYGYSVSCSHRVNHGIIGFSVTLQVQEENNPTSKVNKRIDEFLQVDFKEILMGLSADDFTQHQNSLIKLKMMEEVEMEHENNRLWAEITSDEYIFQRLDLEAEMIGRLTLKEVQDFYNNIILKAPKLSVQVIGAKDIEGEENSGKIAMPVLKILQVQLDENEVPITDVNLFKNSLEMYDEWKTLVDL